MPKHDNKDDKELKDGQALRVPLMLMDSVQRSIYQQSQTDAAVRATQDAMRKEARSEASNHPPGYRLSVKMTTDAAARDALQDVYDQYESELTNAWRKAPVAGPITATADEPLDSEEFDGDPKEAAYRAYDACISNKWRGE